MRVLQDFAHRLQQLIQKLIDLDHFWFGLLAGVEYLAVKGLIDVADRKGQNVVWNRQKTDYERYKTEVSVHAITIQITNSVITTRCKVADCLQERRNDFRKAGVDFSGAYILRVDQITYINIDHFPS